MTRPHVEEGDILYSISIFIHGSDKDVIEAVVYVDERYKNEAKEVSRCLLGQGLECWASEWVLATGEKAEEE